MSTKPTRHKAREIALQILYRYDVNQSQAESASPLDGAPSIEDLNRHFDYFATPDEIRGFTAELVAGTLKSRSEIDQQLEQHAIHWKVSRMPLIDRNVLRMAVYEMRAFPDIPAAVTIDEAIELSKQFGTAETPSFVNGILDTILQAKITQ